MKLSKGLLIAQSKVYQTSFNNIGKLDFFQKKEVSAILSPNFYAKMQMEVFYK